MTSNDDILFELYNKLRAYIYIIDKLIPIDNNLKYIIKEVWIEDKYIFKAINFNGLINYVCENGNLECFKFLIKFYGEFYHIFTYDYSYYIYKCMLIAAKYGHLNIIIYINNIIKIKYKERCLILCTATANGHLEIIKYFHLKGASISFSKNRLFTTAVRYGHLEIVKYLYKKSYGTSIIINNAAKIAKSNNHIDILEFLLANGAELKTDLDDQ
jgi:hypothetical protein